MNPPPNHRRGRKSISALSGTLLITVLICALGFAPPRVARAAADADKGDFALIYGNIKNKKEFGHLEKMLKDSKLFEGIVADLNNEFALPFDVPIRFLECGTLPADETKETGLENAWYDPEDHNISFCYELMAKTESLFKDDESKPEKLEEAVMGSTAHTFFHELGHGLVNIYKLPITGKEEDAVDQLSTFILVSGGDAGEQAALDGAESFLRESSEDSDLDDVAFADSHSLDKQRYFNIVCLIYGSNEKKYAELAKGKDPVLPENRAGGCQAEYEQISRSWSILLAPHMKKAGAKTGGN